MNQNNFLPQKLKLNSLNEVRQRQTNQNFILPLQSKMPNSPTRNEQNLLSNSHVQQSTLPSPYLLIESRNSKHQLDNSKQQLYFDMNESMRITNINTNRRKQLMIEDPDPYLSGIAGKNSSTSSFAHSYTGISSIAIAPKKSIKPKPILCISPIANQNEQEQFFSGVSIKDYRLCNKCQEFVLRNAKHNKCKKAATWKEILNKWEQFSTFLELVSQMEPSNSNLLRLRKEMTFYRQKAVLEGFEEIWHSQQLDKLVKISETVESNLFFTHDLVRLVQSLGEKIQQYSVLDESSAMQCCGCGFFFSQDTKNSKILPFN